MSLTTGPLGKGHPYNLLTGTRLVKEGTLYTPKAEQ